ncbi:MAG: Gp138 family membrane-puncturing spike protein [Rhodanobacteraceae bacterium]
MADVYFNPAAAANPLTAWAFAFRAAMAQVRTTLPVKIVAVHGGGLAPVGRVDVQPLIQQTDSAGNVMALPVLYGLPYLRWQGGTSAVILDPMAGDIGLACFADRDVSAVIATGQAAAPGSNRRFSLADGFYVGATLNAEPTQYVQFNSDGITVLSPTFVTIKAPNMKLDGIVEITGAVTMDDTLHVKGEQTNDGDITATGEVTGKNVHLSTHETSNVTTGGGTSGPPVPGT